MLSGKVRVTDGGLGSTIALHCQAVDQDPLWSARLVHTNPALVTKVHSDFIEAGADIILSNSYQASVEGFMKYLSFSTEESLNLITKSVELAKAVALKAGREVLVAGSVGPYGACQHDGSEYTGAHLSDMTEEQLMEWHRPRLQQLIAAGVHLIAVETLPALKEARAVLRLLREFPNTKAWISFSCKDSSTTNGGDNYNNAVEVCNSIGKDSLAGVGMNCVCPSLVAPLLDSLNHNKHIPPPQLLPRVVYPNSGEVWVSGQGWTEKPVGLEWSVEEWMDKGAMVIGGCCRVKPDDIKSISESVKCLEANSRK